MPVTQVVEKEVIKYVDRPSAPVTHTHTHEGVHVGSGVVYHQGVQQSGGFADCPAGTTQQADGTCLQAYSGEFSSGYTVPETVVTPSTNVGGEYCYGDGSARYDSLGKKIKGSHGLHNSSCKH